MGVSAINRTELKTKQQYQPSKELIDQLSQASKLMTPTYNDSTTL
jgi:hypothetical protein